MPTEIFNPNPKVFSSVKASDRKADILARNLWAVDSTEPDDDVNNVDPIDRDEIYDLIRSISDPEHPNTLEELRVVSAPQISVNGNHVAVEFTPTVPHCGMSSLIGLSIRVRLLRSLPERFKVDITLKPGSHQSEHTVNKQLNDKERVAAALENQTLLSAVERCLGSVG